MSEPTPDELMEIPEDPETLRQSARLLPAAVYHWDLRYADARAEEAEAGAALDRVTAEERIRHYQAELSVEMLEAMVQLVDVVKQARGRYEAAERELGRIGAVVDGLRAKREMLGALLTQAGLAGGIPLITLP